jgi:hypothetical protein
MTLSMGFLEQEAARFPPVGNPFFDLYVRANKKYSFLTL